MSSELQFERLTKAAVAMSFYMSTGAKVLISLHIPILFADYLRTHTNFRVKGFNFMLFYANSLIIQKLFVNLQPKPNKDRLWQDRLKKHPY